MRAPDFSTRHRATRRPGWEWGLLGAGVIAAALCLGALLTARAEERGVRARLLEVRREAEGLERRARALERRGREGVTGQAWLTEEAPPARVLARLAGLLPDDVRLDALSLAYGRRLEVEMQVAARSPQAYDRLLERLEASPSLADLVLGAEEREGEVRTTVRASYVPEGRPR